jgi:hypothetical protein
MNLNKFVGYSQRSFQNMQKNQTKSTEEQASLVELALVFQKGS